MKNKINRVGEVNYNKQGERMTIIRYSKLENQRQSTIDVLFDDGVIVYNNYYGNFQNGLIKHPFRYEDSFAYHIEVELGLNLDDIWNWEKNDKLGINPYKITRCSDKHVWLYCQEKEYHNYDREGNKIGYKIKCGNFYNNKRCSYCGHNKKHWKDSLAYNYPKIAKMIAIPENNLTFEDCYNIAPFTHKGFYFKCLDCNKISTKRKPLSRIVGHGFLCEYCSDSISIPEKFMANILNQLNIEFKTQLSKKDLTWCGYFKYDFYLSKYSMIIETHGLQHYEEKKKNHWKTLEQEQMNDLFKYKCARNHIDNYIVIDCKYSELNWLKENIIKELSNYFDLSNIDWKLAWEESQSSLCVKAKELHELKYSVNEIAEKLKVNSYTVSKWLKNMGVKNQYERSMEMYNKTIDLFKNGYNKKEIKNILGISDTAYYSYIKKYESQFK